MPVPADRSEVVMASLSAATLLAPIWKFSVAAVLRMEVPLNFVASKVRSISAWSCANS